MKAVLSCILALWIIFTPTPLDQVSAEGHSVRVGFIQPDSSLLNEHVIRQYYTAYLDELSKRTDKGYELVNVAATTAYSHLFRGDIDLLLSVEYPSSLSENSPLVYSATSFGYDVEGFYTNPGESRFNPQDLNTLAGARLGLIANRPANKALVKFQQNNNLGFVTFTYANQHDMLAALARHDIDLVVDTATNVTPAEEFLFAYARIPVRVVAAPAQQETLQAMEEAIEKLARENPHFEPSLSQHLAEQLDFQLVHYTPEESRFIAQQDTLRVAIYGGVRPYIEYNESTGKAIGIYPDLLKALAKNSGLKFTYVHAPTYQDAINMLKEGQADLMLDIYPSSLEHLPFYYTTPLLNVTFSFISDINQLPSREENINIVIPRPVPSLMNYLQQKFPHWHFTESSASASDAISHVHSHPGYLALISNSALEIDRPLALYPELTIIPDASINVPTSILIAPQHTRILQGILNKAITQINPETRTHIIQKHTITTRPGFSLPHLVTFYPLQTGLVCGFIMLLLAVTYFQIRHQSAMEGAKRQLQEKNAALTATVQELKEANLSKKHYKTMAETDALTGVLNKAAIEAAGAEILTTPPQEGHCHALLIIDLDHFKEANDTLGHQRGDDILRRFALSLTHIIRSGDAAGRFGGDEFILVLDNIPPHTITDVAQRIIEAAHNLEPESSPHPRLSASIGIALYPTQGQDYQELLHNADQALYQVKEQGRDGWKLTHSPLN